MSVDLEVLLNDVMDKSGIAHKRSIQNIANLLSNAIANPDHPNGDDSAAMINADGFDLLAGEGFISEFVNTDPWFAGWCGIMVNVSDIAAMGGRATAVINTIWSDDDELVKEIYSGMSQASKVFNVPIVGGHTNLNSDSTQLAVSIFGKAKSLLSSFDAEPDHALVAAIDLRGAFREPFLNWNAATSAPAERLRGDLELLPKIAELRLAHSAKDISQAGLLGTTVMLLESSEVGAEIDLMQIPKPDQVKWLDWLCCFPSFGYLLTTPIEKLDQLLETFKARDIHAAQIGRITEDKLMRIHYQGQTQTFWNIDKQPLTGMTKQNQPHTSKKTVNTKPMDVNYA